MSLDQDAIKQLAPKVGLLIGIAVIGKFAHPPSLPPHTQLQMGGPIPRLASLHRLSLARSLQGLYLIQPTPGLLLKWIKKSVGS